MLGTNLVFSTMLTFYIDIHRQGWLQGSVYFLYWCWHFYINIIFISPWMFQKKKRHVIGHFESKDSENYKTFARMASFLRDDCSFHAAFGSVAIGLVLVEHTHTRTHTYTLTQ